MAKPKCNYSIRAEQELNTQGITYSVDMYTNDPSCYQEVKKAVFAIVKQHELDHTEDE